MTFALLVIAAFVFLFAGVVAAVARSTYDVLVALGLLVMAAGLAYNFAPAH